MKFYQKMSIFEQTVIQKLFESGASLQISMGELKTSIPFYRKFAPLKLPVRAASTLLFAVHQLRMQN